MFANTGLELSFCLWKSSEEELAVFCERDTCCCFPGAARRNGEGFSWEQDEDCTEGGCVCSLPASRAVGEHSFIPLSCCPFLLQQISNLSSAADRMGNSLIVEISCTSVSRSCRPGQSAVGCLLFLLVPQEVSWAGGEITEITEQVLLLQQQWG